MPEVQIIRRVEAQQPDESGVAKPVLAVTYSTAAVPPRTVIIPLAESDGEAIAEAIRQDLAGLEMGPGQTLTI